MLEGVGAVAPPGVHHRRSPGQHVLALVVVRDDQIHADLPGEEGLLHARDAAVHGDDQGDAPVPEQPQGLPAQAVAVLHPAGDVFEAVRSPGAEVVHQQHGGGDAVHVVVPEHGDPLPLGQGPADPVHGLVHVLHQQGGVGKGPLPLQNQGALLRSGDPPCRQDRREQGGIPRSAQPVRSRLIEVSALPLNVFHGESLLSKAALPAKVQTAPK